MAGRWVCPTHLAEEEAKAQGGRCGARRGTPVPAPNPGTPQTHAPSSTGIALHPCPRQGEFYPPSIHRNPLTSTSPRLSTAWQQGVPCSLQQDLPEDKPCARRGAWARLQRPPCVGALRNGPLPRPPAQPSVTMGDRAAATRAGDGDVLQGQILPARMRQRGSCPSVKGGQSKAVYRDTEGTRHQKRIPGPFSTSPAQTLPLGTSCITSTTRDATRFVPSQHRSHYTTSKAGCSALAGLCWAGEE